MNWIDHINVEELPGDYQLMVEAIGLDDVIKLSSKISKVHIYLRDPDKLFLPAKKRYVLARLKQAGLGQPFNHRLVALETGLSERMIYEIIEETRVKAKQTSLFQNED